jgi:hypothetical protein
MKADAVKATPPVTAPQLGPLAFMQVKWMLLSGEGASPGLGAGPQPFQ